MKKTSIVLIAVITTILLCFFTKLSNAVDKNNNPIEIQVQSLEGDKYTTKIILEIIYNEKSPVTDINYKNIWIEIDNEMVKTYPVRLPNKDKSNHIALLRIFEYWERDILGKEVTIVVEDITINNIEFLGQWKINTSFSVDASSKTYNILSNAACNSNDIIFETVELTPYSFVFKIKNKDLVDETFFNSLGVRIKNGEQRISGIASRNRSESDVNGSWYNHSYQIWWHVPINPNEAEAFIFENITYQLAEVDND